MGQRFSEMLKDVQAFELRNGFGTKVLTEGKDDDPVQIKDGTIIFHRTPEQERVMQEAVKEINETREESAPKPIVESRLPESSTKAKDEPTPDSLAAAIFGRLGLDRASYTPPPKTIDEAPNDAKVVIPDGTHEKLAESIEGGHLALPDDVHRKLARAI
jgi:hypothetical protein